MEVVGRYKVIQELVHLRHRKRYWFWFVGTEIVYRRGARIYGHEYTEMGWFKELGRSVHGIHDITIKNTISALTRACII